MHFNYDDYPGTQFFLKWCAVINSTMTNMERGLLIGYILLIIYYLIKGNKKERTFFSLQPLALMAIILNPWAMVVWLRIFGDSLRSRIFRFFWLLPILMTYSYFLTCLYEKTKKKFTKIIIALISIIGISQIGIGTRYTFTGVYENHGYQMVENRYKIQNDTIMAAEIVEKDKKDKQQAVNVAYDGNMSMEIRTYDASILSATGTLFSYQILDKETWDMLVNDENWQAIVAALVSGAIMDENWVDERILERAFKNLDVNYAIVQKDNYYLRIWQEEAVQIGKTENYIVFKL